MHKAHRAAFIIACAITLASCGWWQKSTWLAHVEQTLAAKKDTPLTTQNKLGTPVTFTLYEINLKDPQFTMLIPELSKVYAEAFAPMAVDLFKAYPEIVTTSSDFKPFEPYVRKVGIENVNWSFIHEKIREAEERNFPQKALILPENTKGWIIIAQNSETRKILGFLQLLVSVNESWGTVYLKRIGFIPAAQHRGLGKQIISSLFAFLPNIQQIYLHVVSTNTTARNAYYAYGFRQYTPDHETKNDDYTPYKLDLEYKADQSDVLQKIAEQFGKIV